MRKHFLFIGAAWLGLVAFAGCHSAPPPLQPYQTDCFDLLAAPAAAEGYPMEVVEGSFHSDKASFTVAPDFLEGDWGLSHTAWGGAPTQPAPDSLEVRWYSYPEDKFYEGRFLLPQQRIHDLLKQGYWNLDEQKHETYDEITLCFLPKGVVVLWLAGQNKVLLGRYEGHEIAFDFKRFKPAAHRARMVAQEQAKLPAPVQAQIRSGTLSTRQWDEYLKTYPWKIAFSQPLKLYNYGIDYFNAEGTTYPVSKDMALYTRVLLEPTLKPVPSSMLLHVDAGYGRKRQILVNPLDEQETLAAFRTLRASSPDAPLTLYVETDERVTQARLFLKNDRQQIELTKATIKLYSVE